jgi:DNA replication protein DnaC
VPPRSYEVLFINTAKILAHLAGGRADGTHEQRLARYSRPALLVLDDFGLKPLRAPGPEDLGDVINERYEKASIALTSNRDRSEWPELFGEALLASAALDRLTHGLIFVEITGASFPGRAHQEAGRQPPHTRGQQPRTGGQEPT